MSQNLLEEEVGEGNGTGLAMLGIGDVVGRIATDEHVIGIDALGQVELLLCHLRLKMAYPARSQALLGGLHHHLIADDRSIDGTRVHLIIRAHPSIIGNAANKEDKRSPKDRSITSKPRALRLTYHHWELWLIVVAQWRFG